MDQEIQQSTGRGEDRTIPNLFDLRGKDVFVTFSASSFSGEPLFTYKDRRREVKATGARIQQVHTDIGLLVTVELESEARGGSLMFSVLLPEILLLVREGRISTVGLYTRNRPLPAAEVGSGSGGQLQDYETLELEGTVRSVVF